MRESHESHEFARIFTNENGNSSQERQEAKNAKNVKKRNLNWSFFFLALLASWRLLAQRIASIREDSCQFVRFVALPHSIWRKSCVANLILIGAIWWKAGNKPSDPSVRG